MRYCKKCFRNVREEVDVCPYCGAPGLEEYGSRSSGESFTCSRPMETEREIEREIKSLNRTMDAYSDTSEKEETDAYGNKKSDSECAEQELDAYGSRIHNDKDCDNAPDTPSVSVDSIPSGKSYTMRIEYLNMLKKIPGLPKSRIDELMKQYDEQHSGQSSSTNSIYTVKRTYTNTRTDAKTNNSKGVIIAIVVAFIIGMASPVMGIVILTFLRNIKIYDADTKKKINTAITAVTVMLIIWLAFLILTSIGSELGISSIAEILH